MGTKNVLYIGTPFFNYYKQIIAEFEEQGFSVDYYNDRPSESSLMKGIIKIRKNMMNSLIQKYFDKIMAETQNKRYDLVFVVNCKVFSPFMIQKLKDSQKTARFVLYMWDSLTLYPHSKELIPLFDQAYSFDSDDCERIEELTLLPLFYSKSFENIGEEKVEERLFDIASICTAHPNRYKTLKELFPQLESKGIRIYSFMYLNKFQYFYNRVFVSEFKGAKSSEFKFESLSLEENLAVLKKTNAVFDMQHNQQSGLTMRTIETLGANRKLITTNRNIRKYDFYSEKNIFVIENENINDIEKFLEIDYEPINDEIYKKYSIRGWVETFTSNTYDKGYLKEGL